MLEQLYTGTTAKYTRTVAMPVAEASRERERHDKAGNMAKNERAGGMEQFVGSLFMVLGVLVHIEAFAKRSQMTSKSGKSLFTPQTRWQAERVAKKEEKVDSKQV